MKSTNLQDVTRASKLINDYTTKKLKLEPLDLYFALKLIIRFMELDRETSELLNSHEAQINLLTIDNVVKELHDDLITA